MRTFLIILIIFVGFGCQTNHYLSKPVKDIPPMGLQESLTSSGILIATDYHLKANTAYLEECLQGVILNMKAKSRIKIIDEISFLKRPNAAILDELKTTYHVDGLLVLTRLDVQRRWHDVPSGQLMFEDNHKPEPFFEIVNIITIPWTNVYVKITSQWEYHDFTSGKSYLFSVKNDKLIELGEYVKDIDSYINENSKLFDTVLYQNGSMTAYILNRSADSY